MMMMIRLSFLSVFITLFTVANLPAAAQKGGEKRANELRSNVIAIEAVWNDGLESVKNGFGFIVGSKNGLVYIATAHHLIHREENIEADSIKARLFDTSEPIDAKSIGIVEGKKFDLGVISIEWPLNVDWSDRVLVPEENTPERSDEVWFIGRDLEWHVPTSPGRIGKFSSGEIKVENLQLRLGVSGAPLVTSSGIIGMILRDIKDVSEGVALSISVIENILKKSNIPWQLRSEELSLSIGKMKQIQSHLYKLGYKPGPIDGLSGPKTQDAIREYKINNGETIIVGYFKKPQEIENLLRDSNIVKPLVNLEEFRDECRGCPLMVKIPSGTFEMGASDNENFQEKTEVPQRRVAVSEFAIGKYEVTVEEFSEFAKTRSLEGACEDFVDIQLEYIPGINWSDPGFEQSNSDPVVCVSWLEAKAYTKWLSSVTGYTYRLPSESEWEYAARAGTETMYYWGNLSNIGCNFANGADISAKQKRPNWKATMNCDDGHFRTARAGQYRSNAFGLHDMSGNVSEWVEDSWHKNFLDAPSDSRPWISENVLFDRHTIRGGSWLNTSARIRSAHRLYLRAEGRTTALGFRVARDLE